MEPTSRHVRGHHDLRLHLLDWGRGEEPLLLMHGFGHSARVWDPFVADLVDRYHVLALDARGHGDSQHDPEYRYHHAGMAKDLEVVLDELGLESIVLVAHSMGGYAALRFVARHPERVHRLVLVDAGAQLASRARQSVERQAPDATYANEGEYVDAISSAHPFTPRETLLRLAPHWLRETEDGRLAPRLDPAFLKPRSSPDAPANKRAFDRKGWAREETERLWGYCAAVACPTLVMRGEHSPMLSAETTDRMVGQVMKDARAVCIPGAGHAVMLDAPETFRSALLEFL